MILFSAFLIQSFNIPRYSQYLFAQKTEDLKRPILLQICNSVDCRFRSHLSLKSHHTWHFILPTEQKTMQIFLTSMKRDTFLLN